MNRTPGGPATALMGPFISADLPGIGGVIKQEAGDFLVEEIPLYLPQGEGEHLYLWVEKRGMSTPVALRVISRHFRVSEHNIGHAGLKDKDAITRQWISVHIPGSDEVRRRAQEHLGRFENRAVTVLDHAWHRNKLKRGHLKGNRFRIRVHDIDPTDAPSRALAVANRLKERGVPNYFGLQRFGGGLDSHETGRLLMLGRLEEAFIRMWPGIEAGPAGRDPRLDKRAELFANRRWKLLLSNLPSATVRILLSAYQSWLFNRFLAAHLPVLDRVSLGQVVMKHDNGALFVVDDELEVSDRCRRQLVSPTGPLYGPKMMWSDGEAGVWERELYRSQDLPLELIGRPLPGYRLDGDRRALRFLPGEISATLLPQERAMDIAFDLPSGCYATVLLREFTKNDDAGFLPDSGAEEQD